MVYITDYTFPYVVCVINVGEEGDETNQLINHVGKGICIMKKNGYS